MIGWAPAAHGQLVRHHSAASALALPVSLASPSPEATNPASLAGAPRLALVVHVARPYHLPSLRHGRAGLIRSGGRFSGGLFVEQLGYDAYGETTLGLTGAHHFDAGAGISLALGVRACLINTVPRGYDARRVAVASVGWLVRVDSTVAFGASLNDAFSRSGFVARRAPVLSFGASVRMTEAATLTVQLHRERGFEPSLGIGVSLAPLDRVMFRAGMTTAPIQRCAGIGLGFSRLTVDLGFVSHPVLGISSSLTLAVRWV